MGARTSIRIQAGDAADQILEDPTSMLTDRTHHPFVMDDAEPASDRGMLVFQYLVAAVAAVAAALLAFLN
jgi:hypothetical protein